MDTQNGTTMSKGGKGRELKTLQDLSDYLLNTEKRGEELEIRKLKEIQNRLEAKKKQ